MGIPMKTNQLKMELNIRTVNEKYDVFKIETTEPYFRRGAYILDAPLQCSQVCSVYFDSGRCFYVLMQKALSNKVQLKELLHKTEGGDRITLNGVDVALLEQRVLVSLLLNALAAYELSFLHFHNLTGHLYCFHPKWLKKSSRNGESKILKIPCLELNVTKELHLTMAVRTFTSELLKKQIVFQKRKFEQYPKYILGANNTLRRKLSTDTEPCYLLRQTQGDKTEIPFMDIQNLERFESSKMGVLACVLERFNDKYEGLCKLGFQAVDEYVTAESPKALVKENKKVVETMLRECQIKIVDAIGDESSARFCEDVRDILKEKYGAKAVIGKWVAKTGLNLCIIHNALYYSESNDPHDKKYEGAAVQHITLEDFMGNANAAISTVVQELLIKRDMECRRLSLFDWNRSGIAEEITFGMCVPAEEGKRYFFMKIRPDGSFDFEEQRLDLFTCNAYTDCVHIFTDAEDVAGVIRYANGEINIIRETDWFTIPEIEKIHEELISGNTFLRGKEKRVELLSSVTDIKLFTRGGCKYYFVGIIGEGMKPRVKDAANIRRIEPYEHAALRFEELLPLMNVTFVRNGQLTVLPFPFKYLREYMRTVT